MTPLSFGANIQACGLPRPKIVGPRVAATTGSLADQRGVDMRDGSAVPTSAIYDTAARSPFTTRGDDTAEWPMCFICGAEVTHSAFPGGSLCPEHALAAMTVKWQRDAQRPHEVPLTEAARPSLVYYWLFGDRVKIGTTRNLSARMRGLPPGQLLATEPGGRDVEKQRHRQFAAYLASGREWFHHCPAIAQHIATL